MRTFNVMTNMCLFNCVEFAGTLVKSMFGTNFPSPDTETKIDAAFLDNLLQSAYSSLAKLGKVAPPIPKMFRGKLKVAVSEQNIAVAPRFLQTWCTRFTIFKLKRRKHRFTVIGIRFTDLLASCFLSSLSAFGLEHISVRTQKLSIDQTQAEIKGKKLTRKLKEGNRGIEICTENMDVIIDFITEEALLQHISWFEIVEAFQTTVENYFDDTLT